MAPKASSGSGILEFSSVLLFKISPLILGIILALQITDFVPFDLTQIITLQGFIYLYIILIVAVLSTIEARAIQKTEGGGISGATFSFWLAIIIAGAGYVFSIFILLFNYQFNDTMLNQWIGLYLFLGAILIFINSREQIFFAKPILKALRA